MVVDPHQLELDHDSSGDPAVNGVLDELREQVRQEELAKLKASGDEVPRFRLKPPTWAWVELRGEFEGARLLMRLNPEMGVLSQMTTTVGIVQNLHKIVKEWNLDDPDTGGPLELSPEGTAKIEVDMSGAIMDAWNEKRGLSKRR